MLEALTLLSGREITWELGTPGPRQCRREAVFAGDMTTSAQSQVRELTHALVLNTCWPGHVRHV